MRPMIHCLLGLALAVALWPYAVAAEPAVAEPVVVEVSQPPAAVAPDYTGIWEGRCLFSKVEAHVRQEGDRIHGVALVHGILGTNPYHFKGTVKDGKVVASHFRGHIFEGVVISDKAIKGTITTGKKGHVFKLEAKRVSKTPTKD